ncbi:MAG: hypothetical protein EXS38_05985 [Opitutus sp.]|nr:hypothetical protein [Opitutus sp.]
MLLTLLLAASSVRADVSLAHARQAQALLGPEVWSQIIHIENQARGSRYPRSLHALVFEFTGLLWFYTSTDGTQSLSLHYDRLAAEKANLGPLLRDIEPGFECWGVVARDELAPVAGVPTLSNGCFVASVTELRRLLAEGVSMTSPQLLLYYDGAYPNGPGHTVLAYESEGGMRVFDPLQPDTVLQFWGGLMRNPIDLARALGGPRVSKTRSLPLALPAIRPQFL